MFLRVDAGVSCHVKRGGSARSEWVTSPSGVIDNDGDEGSSLMARQPDRSAPAMSVSGLSPIMRWHDGSVRPVRSMA